MKVGTNYPRINLIPMEGRSLSLALPAFALPLVFFVPLLFMGVIALKQSLEISRFQAARKVLESQHREITQKIGSMTSQQAVLEKRKKQNSAIQQILEKKYLWSDHFKEMSMMSPRNVWLNDLKAGADGAGKKELILIGAGESSQAVSYFFQALEQTSFCRQIMMVTSKRDPSTSPALYRFRFKCPLGTGGGP